MKIQYHNWSGITLFHDNTIVGFDLFGDGVSWDILDEAQTIVICLTHGHPEHAGSLRAFLEAPQARPYLANIHLISSPPVIKHVNRKGILASENVHPIQDGEHIILNGIKVSAFHWLHMPLLPPGLGAQMQYIFQLLIHPLSLIRIGLLGLRLPMNAPQLGFHITYPDGTRVLNYSEGIHRLTNAKEVEQIAHQLPADMLFFAVEPDDASIIPQWVDMLGTKDVFIYEAHRPWRDTFHLPFIDLNRYALDLSARFPENTFSALTKNGQSVVKKGI
jgi:hypothetical protein